MKAIIKKIVDGAGLYLGTPYKHGGTDTEGIDSSGLMMMAFKSGGINIPRISDDQAKIGTQVELDDINPGDMLFFTDQPGNQEITHVGLVRLKSAEKKSITFIHASSSKGVTESEFFTDHWQGIFLQAIRPSAFIASLS